MRQRLIAIAASCWLSLTACCYAQFCEPCDFNNDGLVGIQDYFLLFDEVQRGTHDLAFNVIDDFEQEQRVDFGDLHMFVVDRLRVFPGDANWDGVFDEIDLLQVMQAGLFGKKEGMHEATWATGDWYGDGYFDVTDFVYAFNVGGYRRPSWRDTPLPDLPDVRQPVTSADAKLTQAATRSAADAITLAYNPKTGVVSMHNAEQDLVSLLTIRSASGSLNPVDGIDGPCQPSENGADGPRRCSDTRSPFEVSEPDLFLLLSVDGRYDAGLGGLLPTGLTADELLNDLSVNGALLLGESLTDVAGGGPFLYFVDGDFDHDGLLSSSDIDTLTDQIINGSSDMSFDLDDDWQLTRMDHQAWVHDFANTYFGDVDLDGQFSSEDLVTAFQNARYGADQNASWRDGDWNGDQRFDSSDLVIAFQDGGYERQIGAALLAVPESNALNGSLVFVLFVVFSGRRLVASRNEAFGTCDSSSSVTARATRRR